MLAPAGAAGDAANCHSGLSCLPGFRRQGQGPASLLLELVLDGQQAIEEIADALESVPGRLAAGRTG